MRQWVWRLGPRGAAAGNGMQSGKCFSSSTFRSTLTLSVDSPMVAGWVSSPCYCCREPGAMAQNFFQSTQVTLGRAGKKQGYLHSAARTLIAIRISESTSLLHIINKPLNPNLERGSKIALYKSGVVSSEIVYQLASNPGFGCCLFKNKAGPAVVA